MRKLFTLVTVTFSLSIIVNFSNAQCIKTSCNGSSNTGTYSSAIGYQTNSTGNYAFSSGYKSAASGISTTALGDSSIAKGNFSFAAGCRSVTTKFKSVALGENCLTKEVQSYAFGQNCITNASQSLAIGRYMQTNASGAIALGSSTSQGPLVNGINNSLMIGFNSIVPTLFVGPSPDYKSSGNVGIGTTAPTQKLDIDGNIRLRNNAIIGTWSNNSLTFNTNSAARMVILADGKVGIGNNTDPLAKLHIRADGTEDATMLLEATGKEKISSFLMAGRKAIIGTTSNNYSLSFVTGNTNTRMIINGSNGYIGIGTSTPSTMLHVTEDVTIEGLSNPKGDQIVTSDRNGKLMLIPANFSGDNLGNHSATQNLAMNEFSIRNSVTEDYQIRTDGSRY